MVQNEINKQDKVQDDKPPKKVEDLVVNHAVNCNNMMIMKKKTKSTTILQIFMAERKAIK